MNHYNDIAIVLPLSLNINGKFNPQSIIYY